MVVEALPREGRGKNRARQLRRNGQVPAVVYGGKAESEALSVDTRVVERVLRSEAGHNAVFTLSVKGQGKSPAMIRDWQLEPVKGYLMHVDFLRIAMDERLRVKVPVEPRGEPVGVKQQGGLLEQVHREVEVECLPEDIPGELTVDVAELVIGKGIRVGDLMVDNTKIKILDDPEQVLLHVVAPRKVEEEAKPAEEVPAAAEGVEPEVIGKGKEEGEEAEGAAEGEKKEEK
jgi:large subunit ribosomal protein L25